MKEASLSSLGQSIFKLEFVVHAGKLTSLSTLYFRTLEASVMYLINSTKEKGKKTQTPAYFISLSQFQILL